MFIEKDILNDLSLAAQPTIWIIKIHKIRFPFLPKPKAYTGVLKLDAQGSHRYFVSVLVECIHALTYMSFFLHLKRRQEYEQSTNGSEVWDPNRILEVVGRWTKCCKMKPYRKLPDAMREIILEDTGIGKFSLLSARQCQLTKGCVIMMKQKKR